MELTLSQVYINHSKILRIKHYFIPLNDAFSPSFEKKKKLPYKKPYYFCEIKMDVFWHDR